MSIEYPDVGLKCTMCEQPQGREIVDEEGHWFECAACGYKVGFAMHKWRTQEKKQNANNNLHNPKAN